MHFSKRLRAQVAIVVGAVSLCVPAGAVDLTIKWGETVATAGSFAYGLNGYNAFNPSIAGETGNANYKTNVKFMNPGVIRYHRIDAQMISATDPNGWVDNPDTNPAWNRTKIKSALRYSYSGFYPTRFMNMVNWPKAWDDGTGKLRTDKYAAYAAFCAELVTIINVEFGPDYAITHWEIMNEPDMKYSGATGGETVATIYNQVANAMRAVRNATGGYPTKNGQPIKVGGVGFANTWYDNNTLYINNFVDKFVEKTRENVDFLSYHQYSSEGVQSEAEHFTRARAIGGATGRVRKSLNRWPSTSRTVQLFHDEFNLYANASAVAQSERDKQGNIVSAIFDSMAVAAIAKANADGYMAWNEGDGWYGKLKNDSTWTKRPSAYVYNLYNAHLRGSVVNSTTTSENTIYVYPVQSSGKKAFAIVNQTTVSQPVKITFTNGGAPWTTSSLFTAYQITATAPDPGTGFTVSLPVLTGSSGSFTVPGYSVTVLTVAG